MRRIRLFLSSIFLSLLLAVSAPASEADRPLGEPIRHFGYQRVSLTPLFNWWTNSARSRATNARPLTAWVRIRGNFDGPITALPTAGWAVNAKVSEQPGDPRSEMIYVLHPPETRLRQFESAKRRIADLNSAIMRVNTVASPYDSRASAESASATRLDILRNDAPTLNRELQPQSLQASARAAENSRISENIRRRVPAMEAERDKLKTLLRTFPSSEHFWFETFALRTGATFKGLPVYDVGIIPTF